MLNPCTAPYKLQDCVKGGLVASNAGLKGNFWRKWIPGNSTHTPPCRERTASNFAAERTEPCAGSGQIIESTYIPEISSPL